MSNTSSTTNNEQPRIHVSCCFAKHKNRRSRQLSTTAMHALLLLPVYFFFFASLLASTSLSYSSQLPVCTTPLKTVPAEKAGASFAAISSGAPVLGLRPVRAALQA